MANSQNLTKPLNQSTDSALFDAVSKGLMMLLARNLRFPPDRNNMGQITALLVSDIKASGINDAGLVAKTLDNLGRTLDDWPTTAQILRALKPRIEGATHHDMYMLAHNETKQFTAQDKARYSELIKQVTKRLGKTEQKPIDDQTEELLLNEARERLAQVNNRGDL